MHPVDRRLRNTLFNRLQKKGKSCPRVPSLYLSLAGLTYCNASKFGGLNFRQSSCFVLSASRAGSAGDFVKMKIRLELLSQEFEKGPQPR